MLQGYVGVLLEKLKNVTRACYSPEIVQPPSSSGLREILLEKKWGGLLRSWTREIFSWGSVTSSSESIWANYSDLSQGHPRWSQDGP